MLVLTRKLNQRILIGEGIAIQVMRLTNGAAKLGIEAPPHVAVHRQEVYEAIQKNNREAAGGRRQSIPQPLKQLAPATGPAKPLHARKHSATY
jgi:carbon storage regulator